jgi:hypothetical protein
MTRWDSPDADPLGDFRAAIKQAEEAAMVPFPPQNPCTEEACPIVLVHTHPWLNGVGDNG